MKQLMSFRLSIHSLHILADLEKIMHTSKTNIIEKALEIYAKKKKISHHPLAKFAGSLNNKEATKILNIINSSRRNKNKKPTL